MPEPHMRLVRLADEQSVRDQIRKMVDHDIDSLSILKPRPFTAMDVIFRKADADVAYKKVLLERMAEIKEQGPDYKYHVILECLQFICLWLEKDLLDMNRRAVL